MINPFDSTSFFTLFEEEHLFHRSTSSASQPPSVDNQAFSSNSPIYRVSSQRLLKQSSSKEESFLSNINSQQSERIEENDPFLNFSTVPHSKSSGVCPDVITEVFQNLVDPMVSSELGKRKRIESHDSKPNKTLKETSIPKARVLSSPTFKIAKEKSSEDKPIGEDDPFFVMPYSHSNSCCPESLAQAFKKIANHLFQDIE